MPIPAFTSNKASSASDSSTLTSDAFTPAVDDVIVVKLMTWDTGVSGGTPAGGGQTFTKNKEAAPGGFAGYASVWTATVVGSPGSMTVAATPSGNSRHSMVVEHWPDGSLDATPAVNATSSGSGAPSANITTEADNSVVTWCSVDVGSLDPATAAYRLSATQDGLFDGHVGANSVHYSAYATVGAVGTYAMGMTAPTPQTWVLAGVEIQILTTPTVTAVLTGLMPTLRGSLAGTHTPPDLEGDDAGPGWYGLLNISRTNRALIEQERSRPRIACPRCGEPLLAARGVLHCVFDGYTE